MFDWIYCDFVIIETWEQYYQHLVYRQERRVTGHWVEYIVLLFEFKQKKIILTEVFCILLVHEQNSRI